MRQRLIRYASALLVSLVSTYTGLSRVVWAQAPATPACSLNDVRAWQADLGDPDHEATPDYILRTTETFIARCPERPEIAQAQRLAGLSAGWAGKPQDAARHLDLAGQLQDADALFIAAAASLATGAPDKAWQYRDMAIDTWLQRLERRSHARIDREKLDGGEIISVKFGARAGQVPVSHLWLARPDGEGWPATLSVTSSPQMNAFYRMRAGEEARPVASVQLYRCRKRRVLGRSDRAFASADLDAMARLALIAYLASPDQPEPGAFEICHFADEILPDTALSEQVPTR